MRKQELLFILVLALITAAAAIAIDAQTLIKDDPESLLGRSRIAAVPKPGSSEFAFTDSEIRAFERSSFELINQRRRELGLGEMDWSEDAARIARLHSDNMAKLKFFGHAGADGKMVDERADQLGIKKWKAIGENIAYLRGFKDPCATAVEKWMLSTGHRANLLNPRWKQSAIGIAVTGDGTYYFTQVFLEMK